MAAAWWPLHLIGHDAHPQGSRRRLPCTSSYTGQRQPQTTRSVRQRKFRHLVRWRVGHIQNASPDAVQAGLSGQSAYQFTKHGVADEWPSALARLCRQISGLQRVVRIGLADTHHQAGRAVDVDKTYRLSGRSLKHSGQLRRHHIVTVNPVALQSLHSQPAGIDRQ